MSTVHIPSQICMLFGAIFFGFAQFTVYERVDWTLITKLD